MQHQENLCLGIRAGGCRYVFLDVTEACAGQDESGAGDNVLILSACAISMQSCRAYVLNGLVPPLHCVPRWVRLNVHGLDLQHSVVLTFHVVTGNMFHCTPSTSKVSMDPDQGLAPQRLACDDVGGRIRQRRRRGTTQAGRDGG